MVTLILGKTFVFLGGILAGIFFFGGLFIRTIINKSENMDIKKKKRISKYLFLALLSSLFGVWI